MRILEEIALGLVFLVLFGTSQKGHTVIIVLPLETFEEYANLEITIRDISGKIVHQTNLSRNTYLWETGEIERGIYLISIKNNEEVIATEKVVIQN